MLRTAWILLVGISAALGQQPGIHDRDSQSGLLVGQVLDAGSGRPLGGALIEIVGSPLSSGPGGTIPNAAPGFGSGVETPGAWDAGRFPSILTGPDGRFVLRQLPAGRYSITAIRPGYLDGAYGRRRPEGGSQTLLIADGQKAGVVRIYMWRPASISGVVIDEAGEPVIGIQLRAMRRAMVGGQRRFVYTAVPAWTDDRGAYRLAGLPPGDYVVVAVATQVSVPAATVTELRHGGGSSVGVAEIGASAAGGVSSMAVGDSVLTLGLSAIGPPPASDAPVYVYPTTFHPDTPNPLRAAVLTVGPGEEREAVDLHLRPVVTRRVSGVLTSPDGQVAGIPIRIVPEDIEDSPVDVDVASTVTSRTGAFTFPAVPIGHYLVQAFKGLPPTWTTTIQTGSGASFSAIERLETFVGRIPFTYGLPVFWATLPIAVGREDIANMSVRLLPGLRVAGRAQFEGTRGRPSAALMSQVSIVAQPASDTSRVPPTSAWFGGPGQFSVNGLPAGKYALRIGAAPPGWYFKSVTYDGRDLSDARLALDSDALEVTVTFTDRPTEVSGTVHRGDGNADANAAVLVFPSDTQTWTTWGLSSSRFRSARVTPEGAFRISPLVPGDYYIIAVPDEQSTDWQDARILEALSRMASSLVVAEGDKKSLDLRTRELR